jgi:hypothetical protein
VDVPLRSSRLYLTRRLELCAYGSEGQWSHQGGARDKKQGARGTVWFAAVADKQSSCIDTIIIESSYLPPPTSYIDPHSYNRQVSPLPPPAPELLARRTFRSTPLQPAKQIHTPRNNFASHDHLSTPRPTSIGDQRIPGLLSSDLVFNTISYRPQTSNLVVHPTHYRSPTPPPHQIRHEEKEE